MGEYHASQRHKPQDDQRGQRENRCFPHWDTLQEGDVVEFTVRQTIYSDKPVLYKKITEFSDNTAFINILPEDTENLRFGKYVYDVQLTFNGAVKTIIKPSTFTIGEEVTYDNGN